MTQIEIEGVPLNPKKQIFYSLQAIYGIGSYRAQAICKRAGIPTNKKTSGLKSEDVNRIKQAIDEEDYVVEIDLKHNIRFNIQQHKNVIHSYVGKRHLLRLPCHGQKTHSNAKTRKKLNHEYQ